MSNKREEPTLQQIATVNRYSIDAIAALLLEKGIMTMEEFVFAISKIQTIYEQPKNREVKP